MAGTSLEQGHFASKQLFSKSGLIRWSHRRRFEVAVEKSAGFASGRVLDFGCGDATYFATLLESPYAPREAVGAEIDPRVVAQNRTRFAAYPQLTFVHQDELELPAFAGAFDAVVCMEVFEHLTDPDHYLNLIRTVLKPGGRLLLSVPVETGLPVIFKQAVRRVAGWRKIGDYKHTLPYTWGELTKSVLAGSEQHIPRIVHRTPDGSPFHCHKGFNWMTLRDRMSRRFTIDRISASPVSSLPPNVGSQVWFEARKPQS